MAVGEGGERHSPADLIRHLRLDRDRHVAFAFAAGDLLIEVDRQGTIVSAAGAAHALLGASLGELIGRRISDLVATADRALVQQLLRQIQTLFRIDATTIRVGSPQGSGANVLLGGCRLPDREGGNAFLTLTLVPETLAPVARERNHQTGLLTPDALRAEARRLAREDGNAPRELQLVRLDGLSGATRQLPPEQAAVLLQEIGAALRASSVGGDTAGQLGDDAFGVVMKAGMDPVRDAALATNLAEAIQGAGIPQGKVGTRIARIDLTLGSLSDVDAGHALTHAMNSFVRSRDNSFDIGTLQAGLAAAMQESVSRFAVTRNMLTDERVTLVYQPIVELSSRAIHHYEALSRFPEGANAFETILFSEDVGLILDLDMMVCRLAIKAIEASDDARVAVNLSGRSVQDEAFRRAVSDLLRPLGKSRDRLLFELTESSAVEDFTEAAAFLNQLRSQGHAVCLDDFGSGATAYGYLRRFEVDFVKIDGPFLQAAGQCSRDRALIRSVCMLCEELGCKVIGEMIADEETAGLAASLGIGYGQGWLYGKPLPELPKPASELTKPVRSVRRKGSVPTWQ